VHRRPALASLLRELLAAHELVDDAAERSEALVDVARLPEVLALHAAPAVRAAADALAARQVDHIEAAEHHLGQLALDLGVGAGVGWWAWAGMGGQQKEDYI
jgi:hypothetical protein